MNNTSPTLGHSRPETTIIYMYVSYKRLMTIRNPLDVDVKNYTSKKGDENEANKYYTKTSALIM